MEPPVRTKVQVPMARGGALFVASLNGVGSSWICLRMFLRFAGFRWCLGPLRGALLAEASSLPLLSDREEEEASIRRTRESRGDNPTLSRCQPNQPEAEFFLNAGKKTQCNKIRFRTACFVSIPPHR
jgi:hypothetical protein